MKIWTKEYHELLRKCGAADMYEPVIDKAYTDEDIEALYSEMMDRYVQEEMNDYNEPPCFSMEEDEIDPELFDPEEFLIADVDEDGEEVNFRHPESLEELRVYQKASMEMILDAYENREPFNEEEAREEFGELYRDSLEEPDTDLPDWVRESVDPRLIAMGALPEGIYRKLAAEDEENQLMLDELDESMEKAYDRMMTEIPEEYEDMIDDLDDIDGDYVVKLITAGKDFGIVTAGWDDEGGILMRTIWMEDHEIIEDDGLKIEVWHDEDGDVESNCDLMDWELYPAGNGIELHFLLLENNVPKYLTVRCSSMWIEGCSPE